jgi:hypothetical protein
MDYGLISLRVALEQAPLQKLEALSLLPIHPDGLLYLRPVMGFGTSPVSRKRWTQIQTLTIHMESFPYELSQSMDRLKIIHSYLKEFSNLRGFIFHWKGTKGPNPLSLATVPAPCVRQQPLKFPELRYVELENAISNRSQISNFLMKHPGLFDVVLRTGSCYDVLLNERAIYQEQGEEEAVEVPLKLQVKPILNYGTMISKRRRGANSPLFKDVRRLLRDGTSPTRWHLTRQFIADLLL